MAWTSPRTWVAGEVLTASLLNTHVRDNLTALHPSYGTTLPVTPSDGDVAILVDNASTPTYQWMFRYNAGSANADKWEYLGGAPATTFTASAVSSAAATNVWSAALGTSISIARAGVYDIEISGRNDGNAAGSATDFGFGFSGSPAADQFLNLTNTAGALYWRKRVSGIAAGAVADYYIRDGDSTRRNAWSGRTMRITPVRVS